ncbi:hypothetical protein TNCT_238221 [Trichonephila clavata]|uniref:Uncharacterized protein n=1 Tax=Trichonephila clavata TaxID=2740835 RepID=A0A8X6L6P3_TRICU|nr:hypothetical protein TNCT_238221 [Trichonephila clavata]
MAQFRLFIEHDSLAAKLHSLKLVSDPYCPICRGKYVMDGYDILHCSALHGTTIADRYWELRCRMRK